MWTSRGPGQVTVAPGRVTLDRVVLWEKSMRDLPSTGREGVEHRVPRCLCEAWRGSTRNTLIRPGSTGRVDAHITEGTGIVSLPSLV